MASTEELLTEIRDLLKEQNDREYASPRTKEAIQQRLDRGNQMITEWANELEKAGFPEKAKQIIKLIYPPLPNPTGIVEEVIL